MSFIHTIQRTHQLNYFSYFQKSEHGKPAYLACVRHAVPKTFEIPHSI